MSLLRARFRPMLRVESVILVVVAWMIATMNGSWWAAAGEGRVWSEPASWLFILALFIALVALHFVLLAPLTNRWTMRPLLSIIVVVSAAAAYFMRSYAVMLDPTMIQNVLKTDTTGSKRAPVMVAGRIRAAVVRTAHCVHLVGAHRTPPVAARHAHSCGVGG